LQAGEMGAGLTGAVFDQLGQGENQGVAGLDQVAVARRQTLLQLVVDGKQVRIEDVGAILGLLQAQA